MNRIKPLTLLLAIFIICNTTLPLGKNNRPVAGPLPATAQATSPEEPATIHGKVYYHARGPALYASGFTSGFFLAAYGYAEMAQFQDTFSEIGDLLAEFAQQQDEASTDFTSEWNGDNGSFDLSSIPFIGYHQITLDFILEEQPDGTWQLESGFIEWKGASEGELFPTLIWDSFFDYGYQALDPEKDRITLRFLPIADSVFNEYELDISVSHPYTVSGQSQLSLLLYLTELTILIEAEQGNVTVSVDFPIMPGREAVEGMPEELPFNHQGRGSFRSSEAIHNFETFGAAFGTQIVVETMLSHSCQVRITSPDPILTFDESMGELYFVAEATSDFNSDALEDLVWTFPDIEGSALTTFPEDRRGRQIEVTYTGLPSDNSQFGKKEITAHFESDTRCEEPTPLEVTFLFPRDGTNHPGPDRNMPNWYYYWSQTAAAQGLKSYMRFCSSTKAYGYYSWWREPGSNTAMQFFIGQAACEYANNPLDLTRITEGIDTFAITVRHEYQHLLDYHEWWGPLYDPARVAEWRITCGNEFDTDGDNVPDSVEPSLNLDPENPYTLGNLLFGAPLKDSEVTAYRAEFNWPIGAANAEDWANPGKNSGGGN